MNVRTDPIFLSNSERIHRVRSINEIFIVKHSGIHAYSYCMYG